MINTDVKIIYEDNKVIVANKPAGVLSQKSEGGKEDSIIEILEARTDSTIFPIHRLDRLTSGIMIFGKMQSACSELSELFASKKILKEYKAVVSGKTPQSDHLECNLFYDRKKDKSFVLKPNKTNGKKAILDYYLIKNGKYENEDYSLLRIIPQTGRTHQIRVQLANEGFPIFGDGKYGSKIKKCTCALHSAKLIIDTNDISDKLIDFKNALLKNKNLLNVETDNVFPWNIG